MLLNLKGIPFSTGDVYGGESQALNGLGKSMWKRFTVKNIVKASNPIIQAKKLVVNPFRRSKTLRKVALVAGSAAALYYAAPYALKAGGTLFGKAAKKAAVTSADGSADSYQPDPESDDTTGYAGQVSAKVAGGPSSSDSLFTPSLFDTASRVAASGRRLTQKRVANDTDNVVNNDKGLMSTLLTSTNLGLLGVAGALGVILYTMRKK